MRGATREVGTILGMMLVVGIPALLTHATVQVPIWDRHTVASPTPYGYTVSLLLFALPVLVIGVDHLMHAHHAEDRKAFIQCAGLMTTLGALLDLFFGYAFFEFPNEGATLGIRVPAWSWGQMAWVPDYLPLEEFGFYVFGALFMVSTYLWADAHWLAKYDPDRYRHAPELPKIVTISPWAAAVWAGLVGYGIVHTYLFDGGFPGYFVFLMGAGVLPSLFLVRTVKRFVNWHALGFAFGGLVLISVMWEATFGLPYEWWTYKSDQMLGVYLRAWGNLPLEEVTLWFVGVWDAVMFYELFRIRHRMADRKLRHALFGRPAA